MYSSSEDGTVKVWDLRPEHKVTRSFDCGISVNAACLLSNQTSILTGDQNGFVKVWDLESNSCSEQHHPIADVPVRSISSTASMVVVGSHRGKIIVYSTTSSKACLPLLAMSHHSCNRRADFSMCLTSPLMKLTYSNVLYLTMALF